MWHFGKTERHGRCVCDASDDVAEQRNAAAGKPSAKVEKEKVTNKPSGVQSDKPESDKVSVRVRQSLSQSLTKSQRCNL